MIGVAWSVSAEFANHGEGRGQAGAGFKARSDEAWMAGPSAIGSEKGMPSSITSAPAAGKPSRIAWLVPGRDRRR